MSVYGMALCAMRPPMRAAASLEYVERAVNAVTPTPVTIVFSFS
jgi:hypothetical protein